MKKHLPVFISILLLACSPYKKITLTMGEQLTNRWKGKTETEVIGAVGAYKDKVPQKDGYILHFDYSYAKVKPLQKASSFQIKANTTPQPNILTPGNAIQPASSLRDPVDSVVRYMDFVFDASKHVEAVYAKGYPDSVYHVKRR